MGNKARAFFRNLIKKGNVGRKKKKKKAKGSRNVFWNMARNKETLLLMVDVSPSMHNLLPEVEKFCRLLVQKKLIYNKSDEVGLIVFGTEETCNELEKEVGGYEHVVVLRTIKVVDEDSMSILGKIPRGVASGDCILVLVFRFTRMRRRPEPLRESLLTKTVNSIFAFIRLAEFEILFFLFLVIAFIIFKDLTSRPEYNQIFVTKPEGAEVWPF